MSKDTTQKIFETLLIDKNYTFKLSKKIINILSCNQLLLLLPSIIKKLSNATDSKSTKLKLKGIFDNNSNEVSNGDITSQLTKYIANNIEFKSELIKNDTIEQLKNVSFNEDSENTDNNKCSTIQTLQLQNGKPNSSSIIPIHETININDNWFENSTSSLQPDYIVELKNDLTISNNKFQDTSQLFTSNYYPDSLIAHNGSSLINFDFLPLNNAKESNLKSLLYNLDYENCVLIKQKSRKNNNKILQTKTLPIINNESTNEIIKLEIIPEPITLSSLLKKQQQLITTTTTKLKKKKQKPIKKLKKPIIKINDDKKFMKKHFNNNQETESTIILNHSKFMINTTSRIINGCYYRGWQCSYKMCQFFNTNNKPICKKCLNTRLIYPPLSHRDILCHNCGYINYKKRLYCKKCKFLFYDP